MSSRDSLQVSVDDMSLRVFGSRQERDHGGESSCRLIDPCHIDFHMNRSVECDEVSGTEMSVDLDSISMR